MMGVWKEPLSHVWLFATPWTTAHQAPLYTSRQENWNGLPFPPPGDLPYPGIEPKSPASPALAGRFFTTETGYYRGGATLLHLGPWCLTASLWSTEFHFQVIVHWDTTWERGCSEVGQSLKSDSKMNNRFLLSTYYVPSNELIAGILGVRKVKSCSCPLGISSLIGETKCI